MSFKMTPGRRFNRWTAVKPAEQHCGSHEKWVFQCTCGKVKEVVVRTVTTGRSKSCGCLRKDALAVSKRTHGGSKEPLYRVWAAMLDRCLNPSCKDYPRYGGRGIEVHPEWVASYDAFRAYIGQKPGPRQSLDRVNNDRGYVPGNVRWADVTTQANNRSSNRLLTFRGEQKSVTEWSKDLGVPASRVSTRLNREGLSVEDALTRPPRRRDPLYDAGGKSKTLTQWSRETGISRGTLHSRVNLKGLTLEDALSLGSPGRGKKPKSSADSRA